MSNSHPVEELAEAFEQLYLRSPQPIQTPSFFTNMAVTVPTLDLKVFSIVPTFDGSPNKLKKFLNSCQAIIDQYADLTNPTNFQNTLIHHSILNKLIDKAEEIINIHNPLDWTNVKSLLIQNFSDLRDENSLTRDLTLLRQNNDSPQIFYEKITAILSTICNYVEIHNQDESQKICKREFFTNQALKTFLAGLREPLGSTVRAMRPKSLSEAMQCITEEQNIFYLQKPQIPHNFKNLTPHQNYRQDYNAVKPKFNHQKQNWSQQKSHQNNQYSNQYPSQNQKFNQHFPLRQQPQTFPSQPIDIRPNPNYKGPKQFTNAQVFGKQNTPKNVFKPRPQNFERPTPMSISTAASNRPNQNQTFQRNQPHYTFEELHQISDIEQPTSTPNDDDELEEFYPQNFQTRLYETQAT